MLELNPEQLTAVKHFEGPMMALAGPGSGKTTVITYRVKHLIEQLGVPPKDIAVITFTRVAADDMSRRFAQSTNNTYNGAVMFGTFHSFFYTILRSRYRFGISDIMGDHERKEIIRHTLLSKEVSIMQNENLLQDILNEISLVKNEIEEIIYYETETLKDSPSGIQDFRDIYRIYEERKNELQKIDFDDMLLQCFQLLSSDKKELNIWRQKHKYILIDEFQDINKVQYETIKMIAAPKNNLFIVGDDDQSIYRFRGARPDFLLQFPNEFKNTNTVTLNTNYRSTNQIIALSNRIISANKNRYDKNIKGLGVPGVSPVLLTSEDINDESRTIASKIMELKQTVPLNEIAVIYRTNTQSRAIIDSFFLHNIPFILRDEAPDIYNHFIASDICSYFYLAFDRKNDDAFERIYYKPGRMISKSMVNGAKGKGGILDYLQASGTIGKLQQKKLSELNVYLNGIKSRNAYDAFRFVRTAAGYDDYLSHYAEYSGVPVTGFLEIADELAESAKGFDSPLEFAKYIEETVKKLQEKADEKKNSKRRKDVNEEASGVVLSTMHSAKGLEFDVVFITTAIDGVIPHERSKTDDEIEEERRLFYVALTRARKFLYISTVSNRYSKKAEPTPFLKGIDRKERT